MLSKQWGESMGDVLEKLQQQLEATQRALVEAEARCARQAADHRATLEASEQARSRVEQEIKLLSTLLDNSSDAIEVIDPVSFRFLDVNDTECRELGYSRKELLCMHIFDIDPNFSELTSNLLEQQLRQVGGARFDSLHRRKDGSTFPVEVSAKMIETDKAYLFCIVRDITERKLAAEAMAASEKRFRNLVESVSDWVWEVDEQGRYTYCSPNIKDMLGYEPAELIGKSPLELMPVAEAARVAGIFGLAVVERRHLKDLVNITLHKDGHEVIMETSGTPVFDADGTFRGYCGIDRDITERKQLERQLESQAHTDMLTGLHNRRYFFELAELELARAKRHGKQFSLLMLDVDHFKLFNDSYGHHIGDRVLQKLSEVCMRTLREIDFPGRIGGEEFAIMLPETRGERAMEVAERLRLAIADAEVLLEPKDRSVHFTVSIGVTCFEVADMLVDDLLKRADKALYAAKGAGRNQVCSKDGD
ncbi:MAG: sensor domain-containing diguanylate cyclase [Zetaproteobacteria bacterium CG12_big_fil_rev_8_21_14_0_65_54_13]|nr:MAG: sensor domain-containing diguanylate cyclase [Zetaproteobacteria bacterium CG12_big_fil_rev_8_21_14_0_65_54_13]PJA30107.1 MAG: sensor domain-containing diguanylate cyclase [Zetaproteobacteria bacterium CG_4_9_14_3_um_filter_54_145]